MPTPDTGTGRRASRGQLLQVFYGKGYWGSIGSVELPFWLLMSRARAGFKGSIYSSCFPALAAPEGATSDLVKGTAALVRIFYRGR